MLDKNEISPIWTNFRQLDGNENYPTVFKFTLYGSTFYGAKDSKGKIWIRKSLGGLSGLVNIQLKKLKELK